MYYKSSEERQRIIKLWKLRKTKTTATFSDGMQHKERKLYIDDCGELYVFYANHLNRFTPYTYKNTYQEGMEELDGCLK